MSADPWRQLVGYCPMGCGQTLFVGSGGHVTCSLIGCPRPDAVSTLLEDTETHHVVQLGPDRFTVLHPQRERLDDALLTCDVHERIAGLDGPPVQPGRYRVRVDGDRWTWESIPEGAGRG